MNPQNNPHRYIVLDTCIFNHLGNSDLLSQILPLLADALSKNYILSMSAYTLFELIDTSNVENEEKAINATNGIIHFETDKTTLIAAGHLGCLYVDDGLEGKKQPEIGDKIIAAATILNNAVIFTTNGRDFPMPFFKEISRNLLHYKKQDGREVYIMSYFLEPDHEMINKKYNERMEEHKKKQPKSKPVKEENKAQEEVKKIIP